MADRKSNAELAEREPEIEDAARGAIMNAQAEYGNTKVLSAEAVRDMDGTITGYEVILAGKDKGVQVMHVSHDASQAVTKYTLRSEEEDEATDKHFEKLDTPLKERQKKDEEDRKAQRDERDARDAEAKQKRESESHSER